MKRDFLEGLGLNSDQVTGVLSQYNKDISSLNDKNTELSSKIEELNTENRAKDETISKYDGQIKDLTKKTSNNQELQNQLKTVREEMDKQKEASAKELAATKKNFAIDSALQAKGAKNVKAVRALFDADTISVDDNGNLIGFDDTLKPVMEENPFLFNNADSQEKKETTVKVSTIGNPAPDQAKDPSAMSLDEQTALYRKDPSAWAKIFKK